MAFTWARAKTVYSTADISRVNTDTLADDAELSGLHLAAGGKYHFELTVRFTGVAGKVALQLPAGATARGMAVNDGTGLASSDLTATFTDVDDALFLTGTITVDTTAGTLDVQWAQDVSGATPCLRKADSTLKVTRLM